MTPLYRLFRFFDDGTSTLGMFDGHIWTMERPWLDNQKNISCIPPGHYNVKRHVSPSKGECFWITDVPGRSHILIHTANWSHELEGCIAPGAGVALNPSPMVTNSRATMNGLLADLPDEFELEIVGVPYV